MLEYRTFKSKFGHSKIKSQVVLKYENSKNIFDTIRPYNSDSEHQKLKRFIF